VLPVFAGLWPVESGYEIVERKIDRRTIRVVLPCDFTKPRLIDPDSFPGIASELGAVESETQLVAFTHKYGLLGYARLFPREPKYGGDPVKWSLRYARRVATAFQIVQLIERGPRQVVKELLTVLRSIGWDLMGMIEDGKLLEISFTQTGDTTVVEDSKKKPAKTGFLTLGSLSYAEWSSDPLRVAWRVLTYLINDQIRGLKVEVSETKLRPVFAFNALLEVIYWQLASELNGLHNRQCEVCKHFFRPAKRSDARRCSQKCTQQAYRNRMAKKRKSKHDAKGGRK
jgi:hypothetical protein